MANAKNFKDEACPHGAAYEKASPAAVVRALAGLPYPTTKDDLMMHALLQEAPRDVLRLLGALPERTYQSIIAISREAARVRYEDTH